MATWSVLVLAAVALVAHCQAATLPLKTYNTTYLHPEDYKTLYNLPAVKSNRALPGFHYLWVWNNGAITAQQGGTGQTIEIAGSPRVSMSDLRVAAETISKMVRYMPSDVFYRISVSDSVGIFTKSEKLTIFPEYYDLANGNCGSSCAGACSKTCTFDGVRKWEDTPGAGGKRAAALVDNVVCGSGDPNRGLSNILIHEFGHVIHHTGMDSGQKSRATQAYNNAKSHNLWTSSAYAMSNTEEYMATSISVFVGSNKDDQSNTGGMNLCSGHICNSESAARWRLYNQDIGLYGLLVQTLVNNKAEAMTNCHTCPP